MSQKRPFSDTAAGLACIFVPILLNPGSPPSLIMVGTADEPLAGEVPVPELRNSTRRLTKATYAPIELDAAGADLKAKALTRRALDKVAFARALDLRPGEGRRGRARAEGGLHSQRGKPVLEALEALETAARVRDRQGALKVAAAFARIDAAALIETAGLVAAERREVEKEAMAQATALGQRWTEAVTAPERRPVPPETLLSGADARLERGRTPASAGDGAAGHPGATTESPPFLLAALDGAQGQDPGGLAGLAELARIALPEALVAASPSTAIAELVALAAGWGASTESLARGFEARMQVEPVGRLHLERLEMTPVGLERGELLYSVPLTPKETVNIAHREWSVRNEEFADFVSDAFEGFSEQGVAEKKDVASSTESQSKHGSTINVGTSVSAGFGPV